MSKVLVTLDVSSADKARALVEELAKSDLPFGVKIGMELACVAGHKLIREMAEEDIYIFDDQKRIDIPNTLSKTATVQVNFGAQMLNCMCAAGPKGIRSFADACMEMPMPTAIGVTVLTTKDDDECLSEFGRAALEQVHLYAKWAAEFGLDGVVCSPLDLSAIKEWFDLITVCPGIRPKWSVPNDQKRITTPAEAVRMGADWLVIGRPITSREYGMPAENLARILDEIDTVK